MSENLEIWNKVKTPPKDALKKIAGGRLKGMTDIRPQWRYLAMTEVFGPIGVGWKYTINKMWLEAGTDGQMCAFADVSLYYRDNGEWSDAIPGIGGSMYVAKEKGGMFTSDEAYKMAVTDALSVAMKTLGVAADVYMGLDADSKYSVNETNQKDEKLAESVYSKFLDIVLAIENPEEVNKFMTDNAKTIKAQLDGTKYLAQLRQDCMGRMAELSAKTMEG